MTTWIRPVALVVITFSAACGSAPPAEKAETPAPAAAPAPSPFTKTPAEVRADEIIADLARREAEQKKIRETATNAVPVVVEFSPKGSPSGSGGLGGSSQAYGSSPSVPPPGSNEGDFWRQEYSIANAKLQSAEQRLGQARQKLNDAQSQLNSPNEQMRRMGQDAVNRAQAEVSAAQSDVYSAQSAANNARQMAANAGVIVR